jgi:hypothetical protein
MIMRAPMAARPLEPVRQASYGRALLVCLKNRYRVPGWSLAASHAMAAVLVAAALVWVLLPALGHGREAMANLDAVLEKGDGLLAYAVPATVRPVLTFEDRKGGWCRQFEVRYGPSQVSHALSCRDDDGKWPVLAATPPAPAVFVPSTGSPGAAKASPRKPIDDRVTELRSGDAVSGEEERELIRNGWPSRRR